MTDPITRDRRTPQTRVEDLQDRLRLMDQELRNVERERDRYAKALKEIASEESGLWGDIAFKALRPPLTFNDDVD